MPPADTPSGSTDQGPEPRVLQPLPPTATVPHQPAQTSPLTPETPTPVSDGTVAGTQAIAEPAGLPDATETPNTRAATLKPLPPAVKTPQTDPAPISTYRPVAPALPAPAASPPAPGPDAEALAVWPLVSDELYREVNSALEVNVHVYNKSPDKRFVFLNMNIYREGDRLREDLQVEEITQDGVILSLRGQRFRVPAR